MVLANFSGNATNQMDHYFNSKSPSSSIIVFCENKSPKNLQKNNLKSFGSSIKKAKLRAFSIQNLLFKNIPSFHDHKSRYERRRFNFPLRRLDSMPYVFLCRIQAPCIATAKDFRGFLSIASRIS